MNEQETNNAVLFAKMARVMGQLKRLKKSGHNNFFNYDFATEADVSDTIRELLAEQNIGLFTSMPGYEKMDAGVTKANVLQYNTIVHMEITLACGDSGATFTTQWYGEAITTDDKGLNKAATSAVKYWLMKTFLLSTGDSADDPDNSGAEVGTKATRQKADKSAQNPVQEPPAQPKGKSSTNSDNDAKKTFNSVSVTRLQMQDGKPYYAIQTSELIDVLTFSRDLFRALGFADDVTDTWEDFHPFGGFIINAKRMTRKDGSGTYYAAIIPEVAF